MSWTDILRDYNFGFNSPSNPTYIAPDGDGVYNITFTFLNSTNVSTIEYGSSTTAYYNYTGSPYVSSDFSNLSTAQTDAVTAILAPSNNYDVFFSNVANVAFSDGANGAIAIGQISNADNVFLDPVTHAASNAVAAETFEYQGSGGIVSWLRPPETLWRISLWAFGCFRSIA